MCKHLNLLRVTYFKGNDTSRTYIILQRQKTFDGLIYSNDYKMKDLKIDVLKITVHDGVECHTKFNFWFVDPEIGKKKEITSNVDLIGLYESYEIRRANQIEVKVSAATIEQNPKPTILEELIFYSMFKALKHTYPNPNTLANFFKAIENSPLLSFVFQETLFLHNTFKNQPNSNVTDLNNGSSDSCFNYNYGNYFNDKDNSHSDGKVSNSDEDIGSRVNNNNDELLLDADGIGKMSFSLD